MGKWKVTPIVAVLSSLGLFGLLRLLYINKDEGPETDLHTKYETVMKAAVETEKTWELSSIGKKISSDILLTDKSGRTVKLSHVIGTSPKVILHLPKLSCSPCIEDELPRFGVFCDQVGTDKVLILGSYNSKRQLRVFRENNEIRCSIYNLKDSRLGLPTEKAAVPSLFIVDSGLVVRQFVPMKVAPSLSDTFYAFAKKTLQARN
jgi:hypothetical protein